LLHRLAGVFCGGWLCAELPQQAMLEAHLRQKIATHGARITDELYALLQGQQLFKCGARTLCGLWLDTQSQRLLSHAVAALEGCRATQPSQWIDDQTDMKTRHEFLVPYRLACSLQYDFRNVFCDGVPPSWNLFKVSRARARQGEIGLGSGVTSSR